MTIQSCSEWIDINGTELSFEANSELQRLAQMNESDLPVGEEFERLISAIYKTIRKRRRRQQGQQRKAKDRKAKKAAAGTLDGLPLSRLPEGMRVDGNLRIVRCPGLTTFPPCLVVGGCLDVVGCSIAMLDSSVSIGKGIRFRACNFTNLELPAHVAGSISVNSCDKLEQIGGLEIVDGNLMVGSCCQLIRLPMKLHVGGRLVLDRVENLSICQVI